MAWLCLFLAGLLEISWSVGLKYIANEPRIWPRLVVFALSIGSFFLLARALKELPLGTAYVIWTGIGAVGAALFGILLFHESVDPRRLLFVGLVIVGVIGLRYTAQGLEEGPAAAQSAEEGK